MTEPQLPVRLPDRPDAPRSVPVDLATLARVKAGDFPASEQLSGGGLARPGRPACRSNREPAGRLAAAGGHICSTAGGAVACRYRMVLDNVRVYRFVRDHTAKTGVKSSQSGNSSR
jgi:hypothetical protein